MHRASKVLAVGFGVVAGWVVAPGLIVAGAGAQGPVPALNPAGRVPCGQYEAVSTGAVGTRFTRLLVQRKARVTTTVTDYAITGVSCADLTGDGEPELLARTSSGGAHCCERVRVWSLGEKPRLLLDYPAGNAAGAAGDDLDGDGVAELILGDDGLAYFDDLDYSSSPSSIPLVACFSAGSVRDCTAEHPSVLRDAASRFRERLAGPDHATPGAVRGAALGLFAVSLLLDDDAQALEDVRNAVKDEKVLTWLERVKPKLEVWVEARGRKLKRPGS